MIDKKMICKLIYDLSESGKIAESEEVQNMLDIIEISIDAIHKIEQIKKILEIENDSD